MAKDQENERHDTTTSWKLQTWTKQRIHTAGEATVRVKYNKLQKNLKVIITTGGGSDLLGRDWFRDLGITINGVFSVKGECKVETLHRQFPTVFGEKLGQYQGEPIKLELEEGTTPIFLKHRQVPFALKPAVEKELDRLVQQGILEATDYSEWATPLVPSRKNDGKIRLCGDYRSTVNRVLKRNSYPLPTITEMITLVSPGTVFSKIDLSQAYQQLRVDEETAKVLTINTHKGLFRVRRLPFGISAAPGLFQRFMDTLLAGIPGVKAYLDDILITGRNVDEHDDRLTQVLERLEKSQITAKKEKCQIGMNEITFLGYMIGADGVKPTEERITAIKEAPRPRDKQELQSFLGMINFYNRFLKDKAHKAERLHRLLDQGSTWKWTREQEKAFVELKELLRSDAILTHYDEKKQLIINCDASQHGIGVVLAHRESDYTEKPIAYWSRTLGKSERNYAQIDKEALAIVEGVKQFHQYIAGREFTITTDHKPLLGLFNPKKPITAILSPRMLRWCLTLSAYNYNLEFRKGSENGNADCLSRLPQSVEIDELEPPGDVLLIESNNRPIPAEEIKRLTDQDTILNTVRYWTRHQWPSADVPDEYKPYYRRKLELSIHKDCLLWGNRLVAPPSTKMKFLELLHANHPGVVAMKACARSYVWWPNIDQDIENCVATCRTCQIHQNNPPKAPRQTPGNDLNPWSTLHVDFAGPYKGHTYLIVVDAMSKWLEVEVVKTMASSEIIRSLRKMFARLGIPDLIISDNGRSFISQELLDFYEKNLIKFSTVSPYHPSSNGQAERMVQVTKKVLDKLEEGDIELQVQRMLYRQHTTVHAGTDKTPAELLMGRKLRTVLDKMHPYALKMTKEGRGDSEKGLRYFEEGDAVYFRNYNPLGPKWMEGTIEECRGPVAYTVRLVNGNIIQRHIDQLRKRTVEVTKPIQPERDRLPTPRSEVPGVNGDSVRQEPAPRELPETEAQARASEDDREEPETTIPVGDPYRTQVTLPSSSVQLAGRPNRMKRAPSYLNDYVPN